MAERAAPLSPPAAAGEPARRGRRARRLAVAALALVAALGVLELGLRAIGYRPVRVPPPGKDFFLAPSKYPGLGYELVPGAAGKGWGTDVRVNSLGLRGAEIAPRKPAGVARIAVLGDSIPFGNELSEEATFPRLLETLLGAGAGAPAVEVANLAVGGYDVVDAVAMLEHRGLALDPDVVVLSLCLNDAGVMSANLDYVERLRRYRRPMYRSRVVQLVSVRLDEVFLRRSMYYANDEQAFAARYRDRIADLSGDERALERVGAVRDAIPPEWGVYHATLQWWSSPVRVGRVRWAFERLATLADEHGFDVVVAPLPYLEEQPDVAVQDRIDELIAYESERVGFELVPLRDAFRAAGLEALRIRADDVIHPNERGHAIVAERLAEHFVERLLPLDEAR